MAGAPTIKQLQASVRTGITFEATFVPPLAIVAAHLNTLGAKVSSLEDPLRKAVREVVIPSIQTNFDVGGRPAWPPLADGTIEIRQHLGHEGQGVLVLTGSLRGAMGDEGSWQISNDTAALSIPDYVWYGNIHQQGYGGKGGGVSAKGKTFKEIVRNAQAVQSVASIPQRPFAVLQTEDEVAIHEIFIEWLGEKIEEAWP
jgi:phage gpG-like protein